MKRLSHAVNTPRKASSSFFLSLAFDSWALPPLAVKVDDAPEQFRVPLCAATTRGQRLHGGEAGHFDDLQQELLPKLIDNLQLLLPIGLLRRAWEAAPAEIGKEAPWLVHIKLLDQLESLLQSLRGLHLARIHREDELEGPDEG